MLGRVISGTYLIRDTWSLSHAQLADAASTRDSRVWQGSSSHKQALLMLEHGWGRAVGLLQEPDTGPLPWARLDRIGRCRGLASGRRVKLRLMRGHGYGVGNKARRRRCRPSPVSLVVVSHIHQRHQRRTVAMQASAAWEPPSPERERRQAPLCSGKRSARAKPTRGPAVPRARVVLAGAEHGRTKYEYIQAHRQWTARLTPSGRRRNDAAG